MDFPGNSVKPNEGKPSVEKKDIQKVVTGEVKQKPKSFGKKLKGIFFGGDFKAAMKYVVTDVIVPGIKATIFETMVRGSERIVYPGRGSARQFGSVDPRGSKFSYNSISSQSSRYRSTILPDTPFSSSMPRSRRAEGDVVLVSREEAELVLEKMVDILEKYESVSVTDLNELLGLPSSPIDNKWGWTNLSRSGIRQIREGYLLELPGIEPI